MTDPVRLRILPTGEHVEDEAFGEDAQPIDELGELAVDVCMALGHTPESLAPLLVRLRDAGYAIVPISRERASRAEASAWAWELREIWLHEPVHPWEDMAHLVLRRTYPRSLR